MKARYKSLAHPERLSSYWKSQFSLCILISLSGLVYNFGMLLSPYFQGFLVDALTGGDERLLSSLPFYLWMFVLFIVLVEISRSLKRYFVRRFANNILFDMRTLLYNNLLSESYLDLEKEDMGNLLTRFQSDCFQTVEGMRKLTTEIFDTVTLFLFYIVYLLLMSVPITLFCLIPVFFAILFAFLLRKQVYWKNKEARKANSLLYSDSYSLFDKALLYRIHSRDKDNLSRFDAHLEDYEKKNVVSALLQNIITPVSNVIALIGLIPIVLLGSQAIASQTPTTIPLPLSSNDTWTLGIFTSYISTFLLLSTKASKTAKLFTSIEKGLSSWKRISPYILPYQEYIDPVLLSGDTLEIQDFSLAVEGRVLLDHLNLKAKKGEIIGITGAIASGKSAFGKVFLKELPYQGSLKLFDKEMKDFTLGEIKGNIVYMGHQSDLESNTIEKNIAFGETRSVLPYLDFVCFEQDLQSMPLKEKTLVGNEGMKLSGGQKERLALARTLYHKKKLILLDDPFASVDIKTEHQIMKKLREEAKDSLLILISHRLSYFPSCDKVLVINQDHTVSVSTHDELLKTNPVYQELYRLQSVEVNHE